MGAHQTTRDRIWDSALELASERWSFQVDTVLEHAELNEKNRRTVQRALKEMTEFGWLDHRSRSSRYRAGRKLKRMANEVVGETTRY